MTPRRSRSQSAQPGRLDRKFRPQPLETPVPIREIPLRAATQWTMMNANVLKETRMLVLWLVGALVLSSAIVVGFWLKVEDSPKQ